MGFKTSAFLNGVNNGLSLAMKLSDMKDKGDMRKIANATPEESTGFTAEDGQQLEGLASAKDANGKPYYNVTANESGGYSVTPNQESQGFGLSEYSGSRDASSIDQGKVTDFLGKRTEGSLSDGQIANRKQDAMADVVSRSDPEKANSMRRSASLADREDKRYAREESKWATEDKAAADEASFKQAYKDAYGGTIYATRMAEYTPKAEAYKSQLAEYQAQLKSGVSPEKLGAPPVEPEKPGYSVAESLADHGLLLDLRVRSGKADPAEITKYAETLKSVQDEGYIKALQLAHSGAPLASIADAFNQSGNTKFDPKSVVSDQAAEGPNGVRTRVIKIKDPQTGEIQTINTLGELDSLGKAATYYDRAFKAQSNPEEKHRYSLAEIEARGEQDRKTQAAKGADGSIGREERLTYTNMLNDSSRRLTEAQKAYSTLIKEWSYANAKPGSPQAQELESLREAIKGYSDERNVALQNLAAGTASKSQGLGSYRKESDLRATASGDMGADPAAIARELAAARADLSKVPDESSKKLLQDYIQRLEGQQSRLGLSSAEKPARSIASLPQGTKQIGTSGGKPVYQLPDGSRFIQQ